MRILALFCALVVMLAGCGTRPPAIKTPAAYTRIANPDADTVQLQIALRKFVPARHGGPTVWLAGVMHIGEPEYYHELQEFLNGQNIVLFEGINAKAHRRHVRDGKAHSTNSPAHALRQAGTNEGYSMQSTLARSLGLVFQLEAIDYDRDNFVNSDLSVEQIQNIMDGGQPLGEPGPGAKGGSGSSFDTLLSIMDGSSFLGGLFKIGMQFVASSPELQAMAKLTMIEAIGRLKGDMSDVQGMPEDWKKLVQVLIQARNKNLVDDLKTELKTVPRDGSVAVFYGAGHMDDLERRMTHDLHYRPAEDKWLAAFSVNTRKSGISPTEAKFMRGLIEGQMKMMQGEK